MNQENQSQPFQDMHLRRSHIQHSNKENYENTIETEVHQSIDNPESTDTSSCLDHISHTLPVRKIKKRVDISSIKSVAQMSNNRGNIQNVFGQNCHSYTDEDNQKLTDDLSYNEPDLNDSHEQGRTDSQQCRFLPRLQGVENAAFQNQEGSTPKTEATESEVYFADVSSCCNISVKNDGQDSSLYDEALDMQKPRLIPLQNSHKHHSNEKEITANNQILQTFQENISSSTVTEDEEYLAHRLGKRQMSVRSRLPFPLPNPDESTDINADPCIKLLPKDISQNSLCSSIQTPLTETTDDAMSPSTPSFLNSECCLNYFPEKNTNVEQAQANQKHRAFSNSSLDQFLAPDAQYEIIQEQGNQSTFRQNYNLSTTCTSTPSFSNLANTIYGINNFGQGYHQSNFNNQNYNSSNSKNIPPKTLNINQSPNRKNLGSNISTLIQNLGVNPVGLLYAEANSTEDEEVHGQGCHSDGTMDSGWQSGSEKHEQNTENNENATHKAVNV